MRSGIFPGTFDPVTLGHVDIIHRSRKVLDKVVVAVARGHHKDTLFPLEERRQLLAATLDGLDGVEVVTFDGLLVNLADDLGASVIIRGLRFVSDFEYEFQLALMNRRLNEDVETLFFMPNERFSYLNSTIIKEVVRLGGDVSGLVPEPVIAAMKERFLS